MTDKPRIVRVKGICGGKPHVEGTRFPVQNIVENVNAVGFAETATDFSQVLTPAQIHAALQYHNRRMRRRSK